MDQVTLRSPIILGGSLSREVETDLTINTCTFTAASTTITTPAAHGLTPAQKVRFTTTGTLPAAINTTTDYYVLTTPTTTTLTIGTIMGGSAITFATAGTGVHTIIQTDRTLVSKFDPGALGIYVVVNNLGSGIATVTEQWFPDGYVDEPYLFETLWDADITFTIFSGSLPPGLTLTQPTPDTVRISGTPTTEGDYTFTIRLDRDGATYDYISHITINPAITGDGGGGGVGGG